MTKPVVILSHGQPSDPATAEKELALLGEKIAAFLPGRAVGTATLADPAALARALDPLNADGLIFPLFMSGGWFTRVNLPAKLTTLGATQWRVLEPLGCLPEVHDLTLTLARESGAKHIILAAHGSGKSPIPADLAHGLAQRITRETGIRAEAAFIDQAPQLQNISDHGRQSLCLPFFAAEGGHVTIDLPQALEKAGFQGTLAPALGRDHRLPKIIAAAILAEQQVCQADCRWRAVPG